MKNWKLFSLLMRHLNALDDALAAKLAALGGGVKSTFSFPHRGARGNPSEIGFPPSLLRDIIKA